ncbi:host attachment protein [Rhodoferax sp.]|uniref:host attachment protein n=1 Tax=Rhodoferax sp. TaxID=50421 RepID=UPI001EB5DF1D|nr:host attachment protein [Rhodoferax sp.]MBT9508589.1 host attachment protein [Rhodoferax sp.]
MNKALVLISDAHRARCFERRAPDHALTELADFVFAQQHISTAGDASDLTGEAGKGHGRTGHAGTQFEPQTDMRSKEQNQFARQLAKYINETVLARPSDELVLIATSPMLGEIKPHLSTAAHKVLTRCVDSDLTHYTGPELKARVDRAMALPD